LTPVLFFRQAPDGQENGKRWLFGQPRFAEQVARMMTRSGAKPGMKVFTYPQYLALSPGLRH